MPLSLTLNTNLTFSGEANNNFYKTRASYYFDDSDNYINLGTSAGAIFEGLNTVWSVRIVLKRDNVGVSNHWVFSNWKGSDNNRSMGMLFKTDNTFQVLFSSDGSSTSGSWTSTGTTADTNWHEFIITYNAGTVVVYKDGSAYAGTASTIPTTLFASTKALLIGGANAGTSLYDGYINQVQCTTDIITSGEATSLYNSGSPRLATDVIDNIEYDYVFDSDTWDGSNWTVIDGRGNENGTSSGMIAVDRDLNENPY